MQADSVTVQAIGVVAKGKMVDVDVVLAVDHFANSYVGLYMRHPSGRVVMSAPTVASETATAS